LISAHELERGGSIARCDRQRMIAGEERHHVTAYDASRAAARRSQSRARRSPRRRAESHDSRRRHPVTMALVG
jgi:hypothetical protein